LLVGVAILQHDAVRTLPVLLGLYGGITGGDVLIYAAGRWLQHVPFISRRLEKPSMQGRIIKMRVRILPMLMICRAIPASRLPTFLAAGVLRVPLVKYMAISLFTVAVWLGVVVFGGSNLARITQEMYGISPAWLLIPFVAFIMGGGLFHLHGRRYAA
jgi:membrane protein DedA with SNARE-associated domain